MPTTQELLKMLKPDLAGFNLKPEDRNFVEPDMVDKCWEFVRPPYCPKHGSQETKQQTTTVQNPTSSSQATSNVASK
jgi:hypothetical protein